MITVNGKCEKEIEGDFKGSVNKASDFFLSGGSSNFYSADFSISEDSVKNKEVLGLCEKVVLEVEELEQSSTKTISESFPDSIFNSEANEFSSEVSILVSAQNAMDFHLKEKNIQLHKFLLMPSQNNSSKKSVRTCPRLCTSSCILF